MSCSECCAENTPSISQDVKKATHTGCEITLLEISTWSYKNNARFEATGMLQGIENQNIYL